MTRRETCEDDRLEVRIGTASACAQILYGAFFLSMAARLSSKAASSLPIQALWWLLLVLGGILILVSLRHAFGLPVLVLDATGVYKFGIGTVHWPDLRTMRLVTQPHWSGRSRHSHRILEMQLLPGRELHDRPFWLRWLPSPVTVNFVVEGLEFEPERIRSVATSLLDGLSWHLALDHENFKTWQRGADALMEETRMVLAGNQALGAEEAARLGMIGEGLRALDAGSRSEARVSLLAQRREERLRRALALVATLLVGIGMVAWSWI
jgi:hypothetical protein